MTAHAHAPTSRNIGIGVMAAILLYILGFGPAVAIASSDPAMSPTIEILYAPFTWTPGFLRPAVWSYCAFWLRVGGMDKTYASGALVWLGRPGVDY